MNAPTTIVADWTMDAAHLLRSQIIESWAKFERQLIIMADRANISVSAKAPLGQRIDAIQAVLAERGKITKFDKRMADIIDKAMPLVSLRNELAHSSMELAIVNGQTLLLTSNAVHANAPLDMRALIPRARLVEAKGQIVQLTNRITQLLNGPPPSNAAQSAVAKTKA